MYSFIVEGEAVPKQRPRVSGKHAYTPKKTRDYQERVKHSFRSGYSGQLPAFPKGVPVRVSIEVTQGIPKSWSNAKTLKAERGEIVPTGRTGDLDNIAKSILDALNGLAYEDDCQVTTLIITKHYGGSPCALIRFKGDTHEKQHGVL